MTHRISAGALIVREGKLLFVRHRREGRYDFWVPPGGGVQAGEDAPAAAVREAWEETRLVANGGRLALVEELEHPEQRMCKMWFFFESATGEISSDSDDARAEHIVDARFFSRAEIAGETVFPLILRENRFWDALADGFPAPLYLGLNEMTFW